VLEGMKILIALLLWCLLFAVAWPLAILVLALLPIVALLAIPIGLLGLVLRGVFALVSAIVLLPARLLGWRSNCRCEPGRA
jgi:hypothetical protein